jgi:urea carboxylase-associated protein 2
MSSAPRQLADADKAARIASLRARYEELREAGQAPGRFEAAVAAAPRLGRQVDTDLVQSHAGVPAGWYWFGRVRRGTCLRIDNAQGTPGVACLLWNASDPSERFCATDTIKVQWTARIGRGRMLLSDMGRVLASIVEDNCERHDVLLGAGRPRVDDGSSPLTARNGTENLHMAATKLGLEPRDVHASITFFAPVACRDQRFEWEGDVPLADTHVDLYAEMDLLVALSNTPHPLAPPGAAARSVDVMRWRPRQADLSRFCREATAEASRAYSRTDAYLTELDRGDDGGV